MSSMPGFSASFRAASATQKVPTQTGKNAPRFYLTQIFSGRIWKKCCRYGAEFCPLQPKMA